LDGAGDAAMMAAVQFICAKIGMCSGMGLARAAKALRSWVVYGAISLLVIANTINAEPTSGAIAAAINLLVPVPAVALVLPVAYWNRGVSDLAHTHSFRAFLSG